MLSFRILWIFGRVQSNLQQNSNNFSSCSQSGGGGDEATLKSVP